MTNDTIQSHDIEDDSTTWELTNRLRFVQRGGRYILQQLQVEIHLGDERWEDVPVGEEV